MGAPELLHHLRGAGLVLTVTPAGQLHVAPRDALTYDHRAVIRAERDSLVLVLEAEAADATGNRLVIHDCDQDYRVRCTDCGHYRPGRCGNHRRAGLHGAEVGRDLAALLQRCSGFREAKP